MSASSWLGPALLAEIPVATSLTGAAIAYTLRGRRKAAADLADTMMAVRARLELDANDDLNRDRRILDLEKRTSTDHDLLIEWAGWGERHDRWSSERWTEHLARHAPGI